MNLKFNAKSGVKLATICGLAVGVGLFTFHARADEWNKRTIITLDQPTQITRTSSARFWRSPITDCNLPEIPVSCFGKRPQVRREPFGPGFILVTISDRSSRIRSN